jgi:hypothetical protein
MYIRVFALIGLFGCGGQRGRLETLSDSGTVMKLSVEPHSGCGSVYRVFLVNSKFSMYEMCAGEVALVIGEPKFNISKEVKYRGGMATGQISCGDSKYDMFLKGKSARDIWNCGTLISAELSLPACSSYRDTQRYVIKEAYSQSSGRGRSLFGLVYSSRSSSSSSSKEYQLRDEELIVPCIK